MGRYISSGTGGGGGGEYQEAVENTRYKIPAEKSQSGHILREGDGHLSDTPENRKLIEDVANDPDSYVGTDSIGRRWYSRILEDGSQVWVMIINGKISNAGKNSKPRPWNPKTGFYRNIEETDEWRGGKKKKKKSKIKKEKKSFESKNNETKKG